MILQELQSPTGRYSPTGLRALSAADGAKQRIPGRYARPRHEPGLPPCSTMPQPISVSTFREILEYGHKLDCYCAN